MLEVHIISACHNAACPTRPLAAVFASPKCIRAGTLGVTPSLSPVHETAEANRGRACGSISLQIGNRGMCRSVEAHHIGELIDRKWKGGDLDSRILAASGVEKKELSESF